MWGGCSWGITSSGKLGGGGHALGKANGGTTAFYQIPAEQDNFKLSVQTIAAMRA